MTLFTLKTRSRYTHTRHQTLRKRGKNPDKHVSNSHKQRALTFDFSSCLKRKSNDLIYVRIISRLLSIHLKLGPRNSAPENAWQMMIRLSHWYKPPSVTVTKNPTRISRRFYAGGWLLFRNQ